MADYKRPYRPDRILMADDFDADADMMTQEEDLAARVAKLPKGPLIPVQDDLNQPAAAVAEPGDEPAEQLMAEQNGGAGEIDINSEPGDLASRIDAIQKERAKVNFPARRDRGAGVSIDADLDDLKTRLATLDQEQESAEKDIAKRQLYSELAAQLGKFAAATYGMKHGIDLAGLKPEAPKFENEYERLLSKYKGQKGDVKELAESGMRDKIRKADRTDKDISAQESYDMDKFRATETARQRGLDAKERALFTAEQLRNRKEIADARNAEKASKATDAAALKREEQYGKLAQQINSVFKGKEPKDIKGTKAINLLMTSPLTKSISKDEWETLLKKDDWFGSKSYRNPEESLAAISQKLSELAVANTPSATAAAAASGQSTPPTGPTAPAGQVKIIAPNGAAKFVPQAQLKAAIAAGAKRAD